MSHKNRAGKIPNTVTKQLRDTMMLELSDGSYEIFDRYRVTKHDDTWVAGLIYNDLRYSFCKLRHAVTWCIYDYRKKLPDANAIRDLDRKFSNACVGIEIHEKLLKKNKTGNDYLLYKAKLTEEKLMCADVAKKIQRYIDSAKNWQQRKFESKAQQ